MKETIRELFYGNILPNERCGSNNTEIKKITKRLNEAREKLCWVPVFHHIHDRSKNGISYLGLHHRSHIQGHFSLLRTKL